MICQPIDIHPLELLPPNANQLMYVHVIDPYK